MPLHKHEPVPEEQMNWSSPTDTICETIRQAYWHVKGIETTYNDSGYGFEDLQKTLELLRVATAKAKAMSKKLTEYNRTWKNGFFDENDTFPIPITKHPIDVLFLCYDDNANTGYRFWMCAKQLGLNAIMFKGKSHPFGYPVQAPIHPSLSNTPIYGAPITVMAPGLEDVIKHSRVVHLIASTYPLVPIDWGKKNVIVQHGGTVYRQNPEACNNLFNQFAHKTIIQCPDLLGLGAKDEQWIYYPVDTVNIKPDFSRKGDNLVIGHFPSNPDVKGTKCIERAINHLKNEQLHFEYIGSNDRIPWLENLERMKKCDLIIESCNPMQGDKLYGEWGNTALEASALGCAVITQCSHKEQYEKEFGEIGPFIANTEKELYHAIKDACEVPDFVTDNKHRCRDWAVRNHSIAATATRLWDFVYKDFFSI